MNTPTRQAPHICDQVLAKIARIGAKLTRNTITVMIQDAKIAVPPTNGVQLKMARIGAPPGSPEVAATSKWRPMIPGSFDQGPVQATTTAIRIAIGNQAMPTSPAERPGASAWVSPLTGAPP